MKCAFRKNMKKGFTLIELIIVLSILGIIITAVSGYFVNNIRTYNRGEKVAEVQFDVRMTSDYLTTQLRNVDDIVMASAPIDPAPLAKTIDLATIMSKFGSVTTVTFSLAKEGQRYFVTYSIDGNSADGKHPYTLSSKVLLNNIYSAVEGTGNIIYFVKN